MPSQGAIEEITRTHVQYAYWRVQVLLKRTAGRSTVIIVENGLLQSFNGHLRDESLNLTEIVSRQHG